MPAPPADDASSCRGAPTRTLSQPPLQTGWHALDDHGPDALHSPPPEHLSPPEAWRLRDGGVRRAHDAQRHVDEVYLALTWRSFPRCNFCTHLGRTRARSHCWPRHDLSPVISRDDNRSKNPVTPITRSMPSPNFRSGGG